MQTFLPHLNFVESARVLDNKRLGKQRVEAKQILEINLFKLENPSIKIPWENHPAVLMWRGYEYYLSIYLTDICNEWKINRGFKDTISDWVYDLRMSLFKEWYLPCPFWYGDERLYLSHKSNLIRKNPGFYRPIFGEEIPDNLPYFWPLRKE